MPVSSKPFEGPQKPSQSSDETPTRIMPAQSLDEMPTRALSEQSSDEAPTRIMPAQSLDEMPTRALSAQSPDEAPTRIMPIPPKDLDQNFGATEESSSSLYGKDVPTLLSLVALPKVLDPHGNFGMQQQYPNFFLLGSSHAQVASAQQIEEAEENGNSGGEMQVVVTALEILARSETPLKTHASASSGHQQQGPEPRTSTALLLATGLKTVDTPRTHSSISKWARTIIVFLSLTAIFVAHAINMFYYPRYETDEGTYMMSAWAITHGSITPYPYGYGHPPLAWMQIAAWVQLTGGFATFGNAINSGRVLMLLFAVGSAWLVQRIAYQLRLNFVACILAMFVFALSPLGITFQREVLLDNFAAFWFLLALYLIIISKSRLSHVISSAICFGIALLSKEVLIVLFPVMIYVVWLYSARFQRTFMLVCFVYGVIAVGSMFILMAVLKGELLPYEWHLPWDTHAHLSLIGTYLSQASRGQGEGSIAKSWAAWFTGDPLLIILGIATPIFNLIFGWWNRKRLFLGLFALVYWLLIVRGGVVFPFYIIPLIPLIALNTGIALDTIMHWIVRAVRLELVGVILALVVLGALIPYQIQQSFAPNNIFSLQPTVVHSEALTWIHAHVPSRSVVIIDSQLYTDLHEPQGEGVADTSIYPYAEEYISVATDPELHDTLLQNNWDRIDYIVANAEMLQQIQSYGGGMNLIKTALAHSVLRVEFKKDNEFMQVYQITHLSPQPTI